VPKGLGSFDEQDADFFLELLPGARDRDGLPEGLRFWKTRIETTDPERAFRVGLIYGPSGCGKSSMVKAGLLPRLGPQVCAIYAEASGSETEARLLRSLRRLIPALPADGGLAEGLKVLRRGHGLPAGRKVLLLLDQFEQWLFARRDGQGDELVAALRQCDGERVQALCLVRDDFWMAATRFMKELDIDLVPGRNVAAVDLFEPRHARRVLAAYGRAYDALPSRSAEATRDQEAFLDQAVAGLSQDGFVVPVRLSLFAEMVKGRPWTPATLREVGGMDGVGVKFLEDTFGSPRSNPNHRYHQRAAQAVLKALLPETDADIKGRMQSVERLQQVSGYADRSSDFADLIRLLDGELRLITPVDPEGSVDDDVPSPPSGRRCFQLTHDYLVHALRDWLTRKQRETRRGRAELLLAERATLWTSKPEDRYLPTAREWAGIRLLTRPGNWSDPQRRMMKRAGRRIGLRGIGVAIVVAAAAAGGLEAYNASHADGLVKQLASADISRVPAILPEIAKYRRWTEPQLRRIVGEWPDDSKEKLHASLALLPSDDAQIEYLYKRLLAAGPAEMPVIRDGLARRRDSLTRRLWDQLRAARPNDDRVLPVAGALASYDPDNPGWLEVGDKIAAAMSRRPPGEWSGWRQAMRGVSNTLIGPLARILRDPEHRDDLRHALAASLLSSYAADRPGLLVDLLLDSDPKSFSTLFPVVQRTADACLDALRRAVAVALPGAAFEAQAAKDAAETASSPERLERAKDRLASRGALAAVALLRLGHADDAWQMLVYSRDPRSRSALINALSPVGADPTLLATEFLRLGESPGEIGPPGEKNAYLRAPVASKRRALVLALAGFPKDAFEPRERDALADRLRDIYRDDPDAGIHSAAELVLRRWEYEDRLRTGPTPAPRPGAPIARRWYIDRAGHTMVLIDGPVGFEMGSPPSEPDRIEIELQHHRIIPRRFAIASKEVSALQYTQFAKETGVPLPSFKGYHDPDPTRPQVKVTWFDAVNYCNWLSDKEGLPRCYLPNDKGEFANRMTVDEHAVERGGYRLPTEAEWEHACRAGTVTSRYYGNAPDLLGFYEWYIGTSGYHAQPCGRLLPNDLGLFDMLGNVSEPCHDRYSDDYRPDARGVVLDRIVGETILMERRSLRCESFNMYPATLRSAARLAQFPDDARSDVGIRPARTLP
jgi:formylglycine-generating enzyme required for sulfatase activity